MKALVAFDLIRVGFQGLALMCWDLSVQKEDKNFVFVDNKPVPNDLSMVVCAHCKTSEACLHNVAALACAEHCKMAAIAWSVAAMALLIASEAAMAFAVALVPETIDIQQHFFVIPQTNLTV